MFCHFMYTTTTHIYQDSYTLITMENLNTRTIKYIDITDFNL